MITDLSQPLPYTSSPVQLALSDIWLFLRITLAWPLTKGLPSIVLPITPFGSGRFDELYPKSIGNVKALFLHGVLFVCQLLFLVLFVFSLFSGFPVPLFAWTPSCFIAIALIFALNNWFCVLLNGTKRRYESVIDESWERHDDEKWVFINGVAVGDHWMQSNLDRLARTFRRPIHGIHNKTRGIVFDVVECIVQRTFGYATPDVREVYKDVVAFIEAEQEDLEQYKKIVLIMHSQGAVEGGLVLDWLFAALSRELLEKVEVYTFGNAANHFNSPEEKGGSRVIKHIEHYANLGDYVSLFGILHFRPLPRHAGEMAASTEAEQVLNRFVGRLFIRKGSGHLLNQHYLDNFFAMEMGDQGDLIKVKDDNDFMSADLNEEFLRQPLDIASKETEHHLWACSSKGEPCNGSDGRDTRQIKSVSRLWCYRNGMSPKS